MIRLFVALELPEAVRDELTGFSTGVPGAKWARPETLHLTLRFIGSVDGRLYGDIVDTLGHIAMPGFVLRLQSVGQFSSGRRVESLWVGVAPSAELNRLNQKLEQALQQLGLEPERRKFHPHVTLARLKAAPLDRVGNYLAGLGLYRSAPIEVQRFVLYSSYLSHTGAIHQVEAVYPLR